MEERDVKVGSLHRMKGLTQFFKRPIFCLILIFLLFLRLHRRKRFIAPGAAWLAAIVLSVDMFLVKRSFDIEVASVGRRKGETCDERIE